jgi:hypothetical protein
VKEKNLLPTDAKERKNTPIATGVLDYFPRALAEVARVSKAGNDQHNPGQPLHWSKGKSTDHADCIARHLIERGTVDPVDGIRHSGKLAWRALANLEMELEAEAAGMGLRGYIEKLKADAAPEHKPGAVVPATLVNGRLEPVDATGWRPWGGGPTAPVDAYARVQVRFRDGWESPAGDHTRARNLRWTHEGWTADIVAYKVVQE